MTFLAGVVFDGGRTLQCRLEKRFYVQFSSWHPLLILAIHLLSSISLI